METFVVRVWIPDRPGALGQVASRIGAVRGDVVGIDILERGAGHAVDELVVQLPDASVVDLLISEIRAVDGAAVEDVRPAREVPHDPHLGALETAATLMEAPTSGELLVALAEHVAADFAADWMAVVDCDRPAVLLAHGTAPEAAWLQAFLEGSRSSAAPPGTGSTDGVAWAALPATTLAVVLGRDGRPLRARERRRLVAVGRIAGLRWSETAGPPRDLAAPPDVAVGGS